MNTIDLSASELKTALPGFSKVISRSSTLPVLRMLRLSREKNGSVKLQATDLDSFATYRIQKNQPGPALDLLLPYDELVKAIKSAPAQECINLDVDEQDSCKIRYSLAGCPVEHAVETVGVNEWPPIPLIAAKSFHLAKEFGLALKQALVCSSNDPSRYVLRGACLDVEDRKLHYVVATNGRVLYCANSFSFNLKKAVIIPNSRFLSWNGFLESEECLLSVGPSAGKLTTNWVKLETLSWSFLTREIEGQYPNWKQVVPQSSGKATKIILGEQALKQLLAVIPRLPGGDDSNHPVRLRTQSSQVFIEGRTQNARDWTTLPVTDAVAEGNSAFVVLNRDYLVPALQFRLNQLEIVDAFSPVTFWNGGKKMIVMPVKPDTTATPAKPEKTTNESQTMPPTPQNPLPGGNAEAHRNNTNHDSRAPLKHALDQVEQLKTSLRELAGQVGEVASLLKAAEKERRGASREVESVRATLRSLQKVAL